MNKGLASEGQTLIEYHSDSAAELISKEVVSFLAGNGSKVSYSSPYTPEQNSLAERGNRTVWESAYAMWLGSILPALFWPLAVVYATNTAFGWISPFQAKYGVVSEGNIFKVFGCIAYVHVAEELRTSTFAEKAYRGYFVGLKWPFLDRYLVYVPALDRMLKVPIQHLMRSLNSIRRMNLL